MRLRLRGAVVSDEQRRENDRHRWWVVAVFLLCMAGYMWCFTSATETLGAPTPQAVAEAVVGVADRGLESIGVPTLTDAAALIGLEADDVFESDGLVECDIIIQITGRLGGSESRLLALFGIIAGAFLLNYFLPLRWKRPSLVVSFLVGFLVLYGAEATAWFLAAHLAVYLLFHSASRQSLAAAPCFAALLGYAAASTLELESGLVVGGCAAGVIVVGYLYPMVVVPALGRFPRTAETLRILVIQAPVIVGTIGAVAEGLGAEEWVFPLGLLIFLWQWCRLMVYHVDYRDGEVPKDLSVAGYLSVFASPAVIANHRYAPYVGQGYAYLESNYLCRDKNAIILSGLALWGIALGYMAFGDFLISRFIDLMDDAFDVRVYPYISRMVRHYAHGAEVGTTSVLLTTFIDQARIFLLYGAVTHFRVGTWRVLGYQMDPQYNKPWLATNLMALWGRFAFHFREFLVRAFYFPFFFRFFRKRPVLRVFAATMFATVIGNLIWGHIPDRVYYSGMTWNGLYMLLRKWPYYLLLGLGISLTQVYLMRKGRARKPWSLDWKLPLDVVCMYLTLQFFALIHVFGRPQSNSVLMDHVHLFLKGFGIHLD